MDIVEELLASDTRWQKSCDGWVEAARAAAPDAMTPELERQIRRCIYKDAATEITRLRIALAAERERCAKFADDCVAQGTVAACNIGKGIRNLQEPT